jgi:hypothetical protein
MDAMIIPDVWSGQDRALTVEDMENMPDDEFQRPSRADRFRASFGRI